MYIDLSDYHMTTAAHIWQVRRNEAAFLKVESIGRARAMCRRLAQFSGSV